jgi:hypothetical protein
MKLFPRGRGARVRLLLLILVPLASAVFGAMFTTRMPGRSFAGPLPPLTPEQEDVRDALERHVRKLSEEVGPRNIWHPGQMEATVDYIAATFADLDFEPERQDYEAQGATVCNIACELPGAADAGEILIIGAHYDTVSWCPGANDNASGVAALLELARLMPGRRPAAPVRFVAFANEEPPFFQTDAMGSRIYARSCRERGDRIAGMIALETIGCYSDEPGSQHYPFPFGLLYPDRGNFIGFVGNTRSRSLVRQAVGSFRRQASFPSEGAALPGALTGVGWSDHWAFWKEGYPALMVTDTAPFRYAEYHTPTDTWEKLDYERMARVVTGLADVIAEMSGASP